MTATRKKYRTTKFKSFFFFLLLALISWVLTKFSQESTSTVVANLSYVNTPPTVSVASDNLREVGFDIVANGFQFLSFQLKRPTVEIDISKYYELGDSVVILTNSEVSKIITSQLDNNEMVRNVSVEELGVQLDLLATKKVPVHLHSELNFKDGYRNTSPPSIVPDSITISGPAGEVEKTNFIVTQPLDEQNISEDINKTLDLQITDSIQLTLTPSMVEVGLKVDEFTQKRLTIPVEVVNIPEGVELKLLPESILLSFNVSVNKFNDVTENDFQIVCDFALHNSNENFMVPKLVQQPEGLHHIELMTKRIEYLIFK